MNRHGLPSAVAGPPVDPALRKAEEKAWVMCAARRDPQALARLIDVYEGRLLFYLRRFVADTATALDVLQDVWLSVYHRLPELRSPDAFRPWLYRIAHDEVTTLVRAQVRRERAHEAARGEWRGETDGGGGGGGGAAAAEAAELVHAALAALSIDHREVLTLRFIEDMSVDEIAQATRCPPGTVKSRLHYAKSALKAEVERLSHA